MNIPDRYIHVRRVADLFGRDFAFFSPAFERVATLFGSPWLADFDETLGRLFPGDELRPAVQGYAEFAMDALRLHRQFERTGTYAAKSYAEASAEVYLNASYMENLYLPGIVLSHFLWPHHYRQKLYFEAAFLSEMKYASDRSFAEVGVGTGYYSRLALTGVPDAVCAGYDISPSSANFTMRQWNAFGVYDRAALELRDIVADCPDEKQVSWLISVEVLEHLEDPVRFLKALRRMLRPGGKAFITAALNAPNADHIYLYKHPDEVREQLEASGFAVEQYFFAGAYTPRGKGIPVPESAAFIVT